MAEPVLIEDAEDPRIAVFRHVREKDLTGRQGGFIAEGEVVLRLALRSPRHRLSAVLLGENRAEKLAPAVAAAAPDLPVYVATQPVLDRVVGFHIHRGVLGHGLRAPEPSPADLLAGLGPRALALALFGIGNHDNMGGLFRNAAAFGVGAVLLDPGCCDPLYRKAIRVSVGAVLTVPFARFAPGDDPLAVLDAAGFQALALSPAGAVDLDALEPPPRAALLLGAEGPGLPADLLARARTVRIPMAAGFDSLNVAVAAGVALHRLARVGTQ